MRKKIRGAVRVSITRTAARKTPAPVQSHMRRIAESLRDQGFDGCEVAIPNAGFRGPLGPNPIPCLQRVTGVPRRAREFVQVEIKTEPSRRRPSRRRSRGGARGGIRVPAAAEGLVQLDHGP